MWLFRQYEPWARRSRPTGRVHRERGSAGLSAREALDHEMGRGHGLEDVGTEKVKSAARR